MVPALSPLKRLNGALPSASMLVAILALVVAAAGAGYAAGQIGTNDLKNNAVTSPKIKNRTVKAGDLVKQMKFKKPALRNGVEGDCLWAGGNTVLPGLSKVGYRKDLFGTVHLSGIALAEDGPGGDAACGGPGAETLEDATVFRLPSAMRPAAGVYRVADNSSILVIGGPGGLEIDPGTVIPYGAVVCGGATPATCYLDDVTFPTKSAKLSPRQIAGGTERVTPRGRALLGRLLNR